MGNLLKILSKDDSASRIDVFLDFENAQPTHPEFEVWQVVNSVLVYSVRILDDLQHYTGAGEEIRDAISNPSNDELQQIAWNAVGPLVARLKKYYDYSFSLEAVVPQLLHALCSPQMTPTQHLETQQALAKQFAEILHFTLKFDELKMINPAIQNDFSYYRRTLSRMKMANKDLQPDPFDVNNEMANRMSLFYAQATPMLKMLSDATTKFVAENKNLPIENTTDLLSTMAAVCKTMLEHDVHRSRFENDDTILFCLRVMVGVIILYDHVHPLGAFDKKSSIDIKGCIKVLKDQPPVKVEGLLNALRYTSKHFNDESTPKNIRAMLS
ncbi:CYFIP-related Rac1 interactor B-like [Glandiceps talaboti]